MPAPNRREVHFLAHRLLDGDPSTPINERRMREMGIENARSGTTPTPFEWFRTRVLGPGGSETVLVFRLLPIMASAFYAAYRRGEAAEWVEADFLASVEAARLGGYDLVWGAGALAKVTIGHCKTLLEKYPDQCQGVSVTDGDAGTAALMVEAVRRSGVQPGARLAIFGANGTIGTALSTLLLDLQPESLMIVGRPDEPGDTKNKDRLERLARTLRESSAAEIVCSQDKRLALREHRTEVAILTTIDMQLEREEIAPGCLIIDVTTPASCPANPDISDGRLVVAGGCGQLPRWALPEGLGIAQGQRQHDIGAGGLRTLWGCTTQTVAMGLLDPIGSKRIGPDLNLEDIRWCADAFRQMGVISQPWSYRGRFYNDDQVLSLVDKTRRRR